MRASLSHLENIDPRFLEPHVSLVVMTEDTENALSDAHLALDGLAWMLEGATNMNAALRGAGKSTQLIEVPPDSLAALMRLIGERVKAATENPTLGAIQHLRPDLFKVNAGGA